MHRKEIKAGPKKKKVTFSNTDDHSIIFTLKRKSFMFYILCNKICQMMKKYKDLSIQENVRDLTWMIQLIKHNNYQLINKKQKLQLQNDNGQKTVDKNLIYMKRDQFVQQLQKEAREKIFDEKRKKLIIQLEQDRNLLTCIDQPLQYEQEEDFYMIKQVNKDSISEKAVMFKFDAKKVDKYFDNFYVENDNDISMDSEDSQRSNQDHYDYPDESSNDEHDDDDYEYASDNSSEYKRYQRKDLQDVGIEIDDEPVESIKNQTQDFMKFIKQHDQLSKEKREWKTFNYEKDF